MRSLFLLVPAAVLGVLIGCVGDDTAVTGGGAPDSGLPDGATDSDGSSTQPTLAITPVKPSITLLPTQNTTLDVSITRGGGFAGAVTVKLNGLPGGVTADPITIAGNLSTGTFTIAASSTPTQGVITIGIAAASADGSVGGTANEELVVRGIPGGLDTSFASTGIVADASLLITGVAIQKDDKIVLGGSAPASAPFSDNYGAVRLTTDGKLDPTFGAAGLFKTTLGSPTPGKTFVQSVAIDDTSGMITLAGIAVSGSQRMGILRVDSTGKIDTTLGTNGIGPSAAFGRRVRISGGNAFIMGYASTVIGGNVAVGKVNATGFDTTYGTSGMASAASYLKTRDALVQPDGKIVFGGIAGEDGGDENATVTRVNADGSLDTSFGTGGSYVYDETTTQESILGMAFLDTTKILVVGTRGDNGATPALLIRSLLANGTEDNAFVTNVAGPAGGSSVLVQADGTIVVIGNGSSIFLWRLLHNGAPDPAFNGGSPAYIPNATDLITSSALDSYNRAIITTQTSVYRVWL